MSLEVTRVTDGLMVVTAGEDGVIEGVIQENINTALVCQDVIIIFPVRKWRPEGGGNVLQGHLQVLEDKRVRFQQVADVFVEFGVNEIDKQGVGEKNGGRVI